MKNYKLASQSIHTLQNFATNWLIINSINSSVEIEQTLIIFTLFSLNSIFVSVSYSEAFIRMSVGNELSEKNKNGEISPIIFLCSLINLSFLALNLLLGKIESGTFLLLIATAILIPYRESLRSDQLNHKSGFRALLTDLILFAGQFLILSVMFRMDLLSSHSVLFSWLLFPSLLGIWSLTRGHNRRFDVKNAAIHFNRLGIKWVTAEAVLSSVQVLLTLLMVGLLFGSQTAVIFQFGILLTKPIQILGVFFRFGYYFDLYRVKQLRAKEMLFNYRNVLILCGIFYISFLILFSPKISNLVSSNLEWSNNFMLYILIISRYLIGNLHVVSFFQLRIQGADLFLLKARLVETVLIFASLLVGHAFFGNLESVMFLGIGISLIHRYLCRRELSRKQGLHEGE